MRRVSLAGLALVGALLLAIPSAFAKSDAAAPTPGITARTITIGGSFPLTGPASSYAPIPASMKAYFSYINARRGPDGKRGIYGRQIVFKFYDDGYNPVNSVQLTRKLVQEDKVFAVDPVGYRADLAKKLGADEVADSHTAIADWTNGRGVENAISRGDAVEIGEIVERHDREVAMGQHGALGLAGGARGVHDHGRVGGRRRAGSQGGGVGRTERGGERKGEEEGPKHCSPQLHGACRKHVSRATARPPARPAPDAGRGAVE